MASPSTNENSVREAHARTTGSWLRQRQRRLNVHSAVMPTEQREAWEQLRDAELRSAMTTADRAAAHAAGGDTAAALPPRHGAGGDILSLDFNMFEAAHQMADCMQRSLLLEEAALGGTTGAGAFARQDQLSTAALAAAQHVALRAFRAAAPADGEVGDGEGGAPQRPPASPSVLRAFVAKASGAYFASQHTRTAGPLLRQPERGFLQEDDANTTGGEAGATGDDTVPPYHNFLHVCDVTQAAAALLHGVDPRGTALRPSARLALLVAALLHDLGHGGFSLRFLQARADVLLRRHATLEQMHAALAEGLLRGTDEGRALVAAAAAAAAREGADGAGGAAACADAWIKTVCACILDTDMARHPELLARLRRAATDASGEAGAAAAAAVVVQQAAPAAASSPAAAVAVQLTLSSLLKAADISNVARSPAVGRCWAERLSEEFRREGDAQKALRHEQQLQQHHQQQQQQQQQQQHQPSDAAPAAGAGTEGALEACEPPPAMCDREALASSSAALSSGFIRFVAGPYFEAMAAAVPRLLCTARGLGDGVDDAAARAELDSVAAAVATNGARWFAEAAALSAAAAEETEAEVGAKAKAAAAAAEQPPAPPMSKGSGRAAAIFGSRIMQPCAALARGAGGRGTRAVRRRSCPESALQALRLSVVRTAQQEQQPEPPRAAAAAATQEQPASPLAPQHQQQQPPPPPPQQQQQQQRRLSQHPVGQRPRARAVRRRSCPSAISMGIGPRSRCGSSSEGGSFSQASTPSPGMSPVMMTTAC